MRVEVNLGGNGYAYHVPAGLEVGIGDLVQIPRTWLGATQGRVISLSSDYDGPCSTVIRVLEKATTNK